MKNVLMNFLPRLLILIAITVVLSDCRKEKTVIRIGCNLWPGYDFLFLAKDKGFFADEDVNVQLFNFVSLSDSRRAFERGQIDVLAATIVEMMIIRDNYIGTPQTFYVADFSNGADVILGQKKIETFSGLKGKKVGVEPASLDLLTINLALKTNNMKLSDISLVPMAQNEMENSFEKNQVDALCTYPPTSLKLLDKGIARILFNSSQIPGYILDVFIADKQYIESHSGDLSGVLIAFDRAFRYYKDHPTDALNIIANHEQISVKDLRKAYEGISVQSLKDQKPFFEEKGQIWKASEMAAEILSETGVLKKNIKTGDIINPKPVNAAISNPRQNE